MPIEILASPGAVASAAADRVCDASLGRSDCWLGLPTGATPIPLYEELARRSADGSSDLSHATICAVDEFCAGTGGPGTNSDFYRRHLVAPVRAILCPDPATSEPAAEIAALGESIRAHGGLDLCVLGIGLNGHVAFNEPGSEADSPARVVDLDASTRRAHASAFGGLEAVPGRGMTLGLRDLSQSRALLILGTGVHKAAILRLALDGPASPTCPASLLRVHPAVTWLLDRDAASLLSRA